MAYSQVQKSSSRAASTATTVDGTSTPAWATPTSGNLLVAVVTNISASTAPTLSGSTGWTEATHDIFGATANRVTIFYKIAAGTETTTTATRTGASAVDLHMFEYSGNAASSPLDQIANDGSNSSSTVTSRATGTTPASTASGELCISAVSTGNSVTALSWSNSFAVLIDTTELHTGSFITTGTGTITTTATWTTGRQAGGCVASFKVAAGATTATAGLATGTGAANAPTATLQPSGGLGSGTGAAGGPTALVQPSGGLSSGTGAANASTAQVQPPAGLGTGTGTAYNPTAIVGSIATAALASGTGAALAPAIQLTPNAGLASATGAARAPTARILVSAGLAAGAGAAYNISRPANVLASGIGEQTVTIRLDETATVFTDEEAD